MVAETWNINYKMHYCFAFYKKMRSDETEESMILLWVTCKFINRVKLVRKFIKQLGQPTELINITVATGNVLVTV